MGYERKKLQILGGGFSCLPPVDKVPDTDYLLAQNWRSDALGRLISRQGYVSQFSIAGAGLAHSAANMGGVGSPYYVGCNSAITSPTSALYYDGDATPIATGFDGGRIGFASQNGFMYVMNRGMQGRHSAAGGWEPWALTPPPASATVAAGSVPSPVTTVTYTYDLIGDPAYVHSLTIAGVTYSIPENGYSAPQIPLVLSLIAAGDTNCAVTYDGTSQDLVITPIIPNVLILVSGSDSNPDTALGVGGITSLPSGTYQFYLTFQSADLTLESNPGPASEAITVVAQNIAVTIPAADAPVDTRIGFINIYATGGTLGQAYRVGQVVATVASPATAFLDTISDAQATNNGIVMPIVNGLPPAAKGIIGPYFSQLYAWSTATRKNRLFFTRPGLPQYWNTDDQDGDWVDVGLDDEEIVWCSIHGNLLVIYKERTIWTMIGSSPTTATLEQVYEGMGLANTFALAPAGAIDYFVGPNGLKLFDMNAVHDISGDILPLFNQQLTNAGPLTAPGSVLPGTAFNSTSTDCYAIALGHALGRLYVAYAELSTGTTPLAGVGSGSNVGSNHFFNWNSGDHFSPAMAGGVIVINGTNYTVVAFVSNVKLQISAAVSVSLGYTFGGPSQYNLLVFDEGKLPEEQALLRIQTGGKGAGRWFYHRNDLTGTIGGFFGFFFDGIRMCALTGIEGGAAQGFNVADFRGFHTADQQGGDVAIACIYQSHYEDCGFPDNDKMYLEVAIDFEFAAGAAASVYVGFNNGVVAPALAGSLTAGARQTISLGFPPDLFPANDDGGVLARNISVLIDATATGLAVIHNVYLYFYVEARLAVVASTIPTDLGVAKNKECKELQLDIDMGAGTAAVAIISDLPGNALESRETPTVAAGGRGVFHYPFPTVQGFLWQVVIGANNEGTFRLYSARLLMRVIGTFVQAAESEAGFVWDSMEYPLGSGDVSTLDQLRFEMETSGTASVDLSTDLPGETPTDKGTYTLASGSMARAWVTVPLPAGIEARSLRIQTTGSDDYRLYRAQVRHGHVGRYLSGATPSGRNDAFNTLEFDLQSERIHMFKRIEIDLRVNTTGAGLVTMNVYTNQDGAALAVLHTTTLSTPSGRQTLIAILPPGIRGRLLRVQFTGAVAARIYKIRAWARTVQEKDAQASAWQWLDFPLEDSPVLPVWADILQPPDDTAAQWTWVDLDMSVTDGGPS